MDVYETPIMADIDTELLQLDELISFYPATGNGKRIRAHLDALAAKWERQRSDALNDKHLLAVYGIAVLHTDTTPA